MTPPSPSFTLPFDKYKGWKYDTAIVCVPELYPKPYRVVDLEMLAERGVDVSFDGLMVLREGGLMLPVTMGGHQTVVECSIQAMVGPDTKVIRGLMVAIRLNDLCSRIGKKHFETEIRTTFPPVIEAFYDYQALKGGLRSDDYYIGQLSFLQRIKGEEETAPADLSWADMAVKDRIFTEDLRLELLPINEGGAASFEDFSGTLPSTSDPSFTYYRSGKDVKGTGVGKRSRPSTSTPLVTPVKHHESVNTPASATITDTTVRSIPARNPVFNFEPDALREIEKEKEKPAQEKVRTPPTDQIDVVDIEDEGADRDTADTGLRSSFIDAVADVRIVPSTSGATVPSTLPPPNRGTVSSAQSTSTAATTTDHPRIPTVPATTSATTSAPTPSTSACASAAGPSTTGTAGSESSEYEHVMLSIEEGMTTSEATTEGDKDTPSGNKPSK